MRAPGGHVEDYNRPFVLCNLSLAFVEVRLVDIGCMMIDESFDTNNLLGTSLNKDRNPVQIDNTKRRNRLHKQICWRRADP